MCRTLVGRRPQKRPCPTLRPPKTAQVIMAKARALDRRRKSIRNIRKITRTMELIATARFKGAMDRAAAAAAYTRRITTLVSHLAHGGLEVSHPLLEPRPEVHRAAVLVLTAN